MFEWGLFSFHRTVRNWCQSKGLVFFYDRNSEGSFVGARVVEKSTEKGVEKSRLQGFPVGPMENPIDYRFNGRFSTHHKMSPKWCQLTL